MIKVYIASPYSDGDKEKNVLRQIYVADKLISFGFAPYAPLLSHYQDVVCPQPYETWLSIDKEWIKYCDVVLRLLGKSPGADKEVEIAKSFGIKVVYADENDNFNLW